MCFDKKLSAISLAALSSIARLEAEGRSLKAMRCLQEVEQLKLSKEDVEHVAHLARLNFREEEKEKFTLQFNDILVYMDILNTVDTAGVDAMTHAITLNNVFRDDEVQVSIGIEKILANAPDRMGECFRVPKMIE